MDSDILELSDNINVFVGKNNAGKSTLLNTILILQHQELANLNVNHNSKLGSITITFKEYIYNDSILLPDENHTYGISMTLAPGEKGSLNKFLHIYLKRSNGLVSDGGNYHDLPVNEPQNIIYPFTSNRKATKLEEAVNLSTTASITGDLRYIYSRVEKLCNRFESGHDLYYEIIKNFFGYNISTIKTASGSKAGYKINDDKFIPVTLMGQGVLHILGFISSLAVAENKIFIIEEPENDLHPDAIKTLLKLIKLKSKTNQFFISTHSNIVLKELGTEDSTKIFQVKMEIDSKSNVPISRVVKIGKTTSEKMEILKDLGYEFQDFELWHAWLFLEEASAERIIREYLIKWFAPNLTGKLKTFSARSKDEVIPKFDNFNSLFVFLHLEPTYKNMAWVVIDEGEEEKEIIDKMKKVYVEKNDWEDTRFRQFSKHNFEEYYPTEFKSAEEIQAVLKIENKQQRRETKKELLNQLIEWIKVDEERAKKAFETSAKEVIDILKEIEKEIGA